MGVGSHDKHLYMYRWVVEDDLQYILYDCLQSRII
jgi:hypothetical protein